MCIDDTGGKVHIFLHSAPAFSSTDDNWYIIFSKFAPHFFDGLIRDINGKTQFKPTLKLVANWEKTRPPPPSPAILALLDILDNLNNFFFFLKCWRREWAPSQSMRG